MSRGLRIIFTVSPELVETVDAAARREGLGRSEWIRRTLAVAAEVPEPVVAPVRPRAVPSSTVAPAPGTYLRR